MMRLPDALTGDLLVILCSAVMLLTTIARADGARGAAHGGYASSPPSTVSTAPEV